MRAVRKHACNGNLSKTSTKEKLSFSYLTTPGKSDTLPKGGHALVLDQGRDRGGQALAGYLHSGFNSLNGMREIDGEYTCCSAQRDGLCKVGLLALRRWRCHGGKEEKVRRGAEDVPAKEHYKVRSAKIPRQNLTNLLLGLRR